jgi:glyoxalase-like protein
VTAGFDHLVVAIRSLPEGIAQVERLTGVKAAIGGQHPGRGTENALVSLGADSYLEIIAPQAGVQLSPQDEAMRAVDQLKVVTWAVRVSDVNEALALLKTAGFATSAPRPGARLTPAGERLEWTTFALDDRSLPVAPFFIRWSAGTRHPSSTAPGGCSLEQLQVQDRSAGRLATALTALGVGRVTVADGDPAIQVTLRCGSKTVSLM